MAKFRQKNFGILGHIVGGASIGAGIGGTLNKVGIKMPIKFRGKTSVLDTARSMTTAGAIIGAALGALSGTAVEVSRLISRSQVDKRLMERVVEDLRKTGFIEGTDFTRDPKIANELKTKVCIVVSKNSGELRILINSVADSKLKSLVDRTVKNIPNTSAVTKKATDKFNDITITTISDSSAADVGLIAGLAEKFIRSNYPVYMVEVG